MSRLFYLALISLLLTSCFTGRESRLTTFAVSTDSLLLFDSTRNRAVPVQVYYPEIPGHAAPQLVILNHGYGQNIPGSNKAYSYIANNLAAHGYFVASIQHELPTDELLAMTGNLRETRRPNWERGAQNIHFTIAAIKKRWPELNSRSVSLIGHSNGGDMVMLYAQQYPGEIQKAISLDNRRMPLPRTRRPAIYSLRSSDQPADEGVLPDVAEQKRWRITVIRLEHTPHNDMDDDASETQREEINRYMLQFLKEK